MRIAVCVDDQNGMLFNRRRQSQDRLLREDLLREAGDRPLWINAYSARQFGPLPPNVRTAEDFLEQAGPGEFCFVEDQDILPYQERIEGILIYRWNRRYPADTRFPLSLEGWKLERREEFPGSSHERITKEVYRL